MKYAPIQVLPDVPAGGVFAGIDWATADHVACVVDMAGRILDRFSAAHHKAGIEMLITRLRENGAAEVAIERGGGVLVEALLAAGLTVVVVSSRQVKNLRARYRSGGGKDDRFDAFVLADTLRTDRARLRPLVPDAPATLALRAAVRARRDLIAHRVAACNQLRAHLAVAFPAAAGLFFDLASPISLRFLASFGSQDAAAGLDEQAIAAWLKTIPERGKTAPASVLCARLRAAPDGVTGEDGAALAVITAALTVTVGMLAAQVKILEAGIGAQLAAHPDGHIFTSLPRAWHAARRQAAGRDRGLPVPLPRSAVPGRPGRGRPGHPRVRHAHLARLPVGGQPPAPRCRLRLRGRLPARQPLGRVRLPGRPRPRQGPPARHPHPGPRLDPRHLALLAGRHRLRPRQAHCPPAHPGPAGRASSRRGHPVTAALSAALRASAAGLYPDEAGSELLISHGGFLYRSDFTGFVDTFTSISDGTTPMAQINWDAAISALHDGQLPVCSGERRILQLAASIAAGSPVCLRDTIPGLDSRNLHLVITAIRHAAGQRPPHC